MSHSQEFGKQPDAEALEDDERQYGHGPLSKEEMEMRFPGRPINHSKTLPFHELFTSLFNPLNDNKKKPPSHTVARAKQGPHGPSKLNPNQARELIIQRFFSRWRKEVGDDIYPALRLIIPEKDRDRAMYGLKEKAIGKLLVKLMKIDKNSEDAYNLMNWKLPGQTTVSRMAGDFAGRCFEILTKRPMRTDIGDMRIAEVNDLLDRLSAAQKEENQLPIFETFYNRMNAEELMWLIRIILRQMKIGASEKTILNIWHPEGEVLFNVSSNLRRVAWELKDHSIHLEADKTGIGLMQCFQPQLAGFQLKSFQIMVDSMQPVENDDVFWIEEKLDGERIQLHMKKDDSVAGGMEFGFWSRKAKEYTYLYGSGFEDENAALTRHIRDAFNPNVRNLILDGEMITWDPELDMPVGFGTLKSAALSEQRDPYAGTGHRPVFRVFDLLYLNDVPILQYTLRDRRAALQKCITNVHRRLEIHEYKEATTASQIESELRKVVEEASEGLVLKNPRSSYKLNERTSDWTKVKPEYMTEFGESLDCLIIGGYYGSGHRGGRLSSFLCGLKVGKNYVQKGANPMKCFSFFKVGGGFRLEDYENIRHHTDGKWMEYDPMRPPLEYIELGGKDWVQFERPDVWIKPCDSLVVEVKAASVTTSDQFRCGFTLRFPRFKRLRMDKDWTTALDTSEFSELKRRVEEESRNKDFNIETRRGNTKKQRKSLMIAGDQKVDTPYAGPLTNAFEELNFCILSESMKLPRKSKAELEQIVKANGGKIFQNPLAAEDMLCIADKRVVKVASLMKSGKLNIVRPNWVLDTLAQASIDGRRPNFLLPFEPGHMLFTTKEDEEGVNTHVDRFGDSFARDVESQELIQLLMGIKLEDASDSEVGELVEELDHYSDGMAHVKGQMCSFIRSYMDFKQHENLKTSSVVMDEADLQLKLMGNVIRFAGGTVSDNIDDKEITHIVVSPGSPRLSALRKKIAGRKRIPKIVTSAWVDDSWKEGTVLNEEMYAPTTR